MLLTDIWLDSRLKGLSIESKNTKTISENYVQTIQIKSKNFNPELSENSPEIQPELFEHSPENS